MNITARNTKMIDPVIRDLNRYLAEQDYLEREHDMFEKIKDDIIDDCYVDSLGNTWSLDDIDLPEIAVTLLRDPDAAHTELMIAINKLANQALEFEKDLKNEGY